MRANTILDTIGNTPHVRLHRLFPSRVEVWLKLERANPGGSIKDRIGLAMIEDAERRGVLRKDSVIIEPTSGNTGIGLAMAAAVKGYRLVLVMPESMSVERRRVMASYGATLDLTPRQCREVLRIVQEALVNVRRHSGARVGERPRLKSALGVVTRLHISSSPQSMCGV